MPATARPLSPHLSVYRWQIQMVTSILHRATGVFLSFGTILIAAGLIALAWSESAFAQIRAFSSSWIGLVLMLGWTWSLIFHLLNGIRHLLQDVGLGYEPATFVRNSWVVTIASVLATIALWAFVFAGRGAP